MNRIDGKVPDVLVGGVGLGVLDDQPEDVLEKIIEAGEKAKAMLEEDEENGQD